MTLSYALKAFLRLIWAHRCANLITLPRGRYSVVVLDREGAEVIEPLLSDLDYVVLPVRGESIYCSMQLLMMTLRNLTLLRSPLAAYSLAVVKLLKPKLVITFIDNNGIFHAIRPLCDGVNFLAVQNGLRCLSRDYKHGGQINHDHFVCFGQAHENMYRNFGANVRKYHPLGSLKDAYYRESLKKAPCIDFDICLISEAEPALERLYPELWRGIVVLAEYLARYCKNSGSRVAIIARTDPTKDIGRLAFEENFYRNIFQGADYIIVKNKLSEFRSYSVVDSSSLSLCVFSTLGVESFGRGKKILFVNATGLDDYSLPEQGIWSLIDPSYSQFENRMDQLLRISVEDYIKTKTESAQGLMNIIETPINKSSLRQLILELSTDS